MTKENVTLKDATLVIDATNAVIGRLSALVAKRLLEGEKVIIVNAEKSVFSGKEKTVTAVYYRRRGMTQKANPEHAMKWPRRPDFLFKKIVEGMLPKHSNRKTTAMKTLRVYIGNPQNVEKAVKPVKTSEELGRSFVTLEQICRNLGWNKK